MYAKICIVCQKKFHALRINKLYCSKQCANRTRYLPRELVEQLIERNSKYAIKATRYVAMVTDNNGEETAVGYEAENTSFNNPLGNDEGLLKALALEELQKRQRQASLKSETGFGVVVEEDKIESMVLADEPCPDCGSNHHRSCQQPQQKKFKIKPIQKNGG